MNNFTALIIALSLAAGCGSDDNNTAQNNTAQNQLVVL